MSTIKNTITKKSKLWVRTHNSSKTLLKGGELSEALELLETAEAKFLLKNEMDFIKASQRNATKKRVFLIIFLLSALSGGVYYLINKPPSVEVVKLNENKIESKEKEKVAEKVEKQQMVKQEITKPEVVVEKNSSVVKEEVVKIPEPTQPPVNQVEVNNKVEKKVEQKVEQKIENSSEKTNLILAKKFILADDIGNSNEAKSEEKIIFNSLYDVSLQNIQSHSLNKPDGLLLNNNKFMMVENNKMVIWDTQKQIKIETLKQKSIKSFKLSPNKNLIAVISKNRKLKVWNLKKGKIILALDTSPVRDIIFNRRSKKIVVLSKKGRLSLWKVTGKVKQLKTFTHRNKIKGISLNNKSDRILFFNDKKEAILLAIEWKKNKIRATLSHKFKILGAIFNKNNSEILTFGNKGIDVWSIKRNKKLFSIQANNIIMVKYSRDGSKIIATTKDNRLKIWDNRGKEILSINTETRVKEVEFNRNNSKLIFWSNKQATIYDVNNLKSILNQKCNFSKTDGKILACGVGNKVQFFDVTDGKKLYNLYHQNNINGLMFKNGKIITFDNKDIRFWKRDNTNNISLNFRLGAEKDFFLSTNGDKITTLTKKFFLLHLKNNPKKPIWFRHDAVLGTSFNGDDSLILSYNRNSIIVWNKNKRVKLATLNTRATLKRADFIDNNRVIAIKKNSLLLWSVQDKKMILKIKHLNIDKVEVSKDYIAVMDKKNITIIDIKTQKKVKLPQMKITNFYFGKNGDKLFTSDGSILKIFDTKTAKKLSELNLPAKNVISNSEAKLFVGFEDNKVSLYDITGKIILSYIHNDKVIEARFNSIENGIISSSKGAIIKKTVLFNQNMKNSDYPTKVKIQSGAIFENGKIKAISKKEWEKLIR